jgi:pilus assembly protein CpaE
MQAGASEYLIKPFQVVDVATAIRRVYDLNRKRAAYKFDSDAQAYAPEVFAIFSATGGVGKSQIAINLASALHSATLARVALMDLALYFGDVGLLLRLNPKRSIADLAKSSTFDNDWAEMMQKGPHDIDVLLAPSAPEFAEAVKPPLIDNILREMQLLYDFVVMDLPSNLTEENLTGLDVATRIVIVTDTSIPSLKNTKLTLGTFDAMGVEPERLLLVVNHHQGRTDRSRNDVEKLLDIPVSWELSHDAKVVERAIAAAQPFVDVSPEAEISQQVRDLVALLVPTERRVSEIQGAALGRGGLRSRLFARR